MLTPRERRVSNRSAERRWDAAESLPTTRARSPVISIITAESALYALVIRGIKVIMLPLTGFARGPNLPPPVDLTVPAVVAGMVPPSSRRPLES